MKYLNFGGWHWYATDNAEKIDPEKGGKWMHFFSDEVFARIACERAIEEGVCDSCKCTDTAATGTATGVICFYLNADDIDGHKRAIEFMLQNNMIQKTKTGKLYNISFKLNSQTRAHEYGDDYKGKITLDRFVDLKTGEWIYK